MKLVLDGVASPALLDSYSAERAPVGKQVVDRAEQGIAETSRIFESLGLLSTGDPERMGENMAVRKESTQEAEKQRRALREVIDFKKYEFNAQGFEFNQRYVSDAIVPDPSGDAAEQPNCDMELLHVPSTSRGPRFRTRGLPGTALSCPHWTSVGAEDSSPASVGKCGWRHVPLRTRWGSSW